MRSAIIAALVGAAVAVPLTETVYDTKVYTITSCGPEVTDCPGRKTSTPAVPTTTCTEGEKHTYPGPPAWVSTTAAASSSVVVVVSSSPAPPPYVETSKPAPPPVSSAMVESSAPAPPPVKSTAPMPAPPASSSQAAVASSGPAPPPYSAPWSAPVVASTGVMTKPVPVASGSSKVTASASVGTVSTGLPSASATVSSYWTKTTSPATYTGAASHVQAGVLMGAGAVAAFFL